MKELHYSALPLNENEEYDLETFSESQLSDFYWDNPESIPDRD